MRIIGCVALAVLAGGLTSCDDRPSWAREQIGPSYFDSAGAYSNAGVSTRLRGDPVPLDASTLEGDTLGRSFHLFRSRCAACHRPPDPSMKKARHWPYLVGRMRERSAKAGLIPMTEAEADTILGFLQKHGMP